MTATAPPTQSAHLGVGVDYAKRGWPVLPSCYPVEGACGCGGGHQGHDIGKAPIGRLAPNGIKNATTNTATIDRWLRAAPAANLSIDLARAGLFFIDPDSPDALAEAEREGVEGGARRESR